MRIVSLTSAMLRDPQGVGRNAYYELVMLHEEIGGIAGAIVDEIDGRYYMKGERGEPSLVCRQLEVDSIEVP